MKRFFIIITFVFSYLPSQQLMVQTEKGSVTFPALQTVDAVVVSNTAATVPSPDERVSVIVEWTIPGRIEQRSAGRLFSRSATESARKKLTASVVDMIINREFESVINGLSASVKRSDVERIAALDGVKRVTPDFSVAPVPMDVLVSTPTVPQSGSAASGKGVRIGIIDTGIDYRHEAFGGGFGNGFPVAGGYDFVNNDADPSDDNGHGTHVAGIIGGVSSAIRGLAHGATFYSYKVLDHNGAGSASAVIAAIERAVADSVDVINLSLGSPGGSPNDPLARAVNRAVEAGIVVVAAAGNTGEFGSINSPGVAALALTVGAVQSHSIASFSSKGPVTEDYTIKPDVVAPGVGILSAKMGGGYVSMSGTSMATPFVTAVAAALQELHPDWSALQIRGAIISNAHDLRLSLFSQGHGLVDEAILNSVVFTSPSKISFGFNPPGENTWTRSEQISVHNRTAAAKRYRFVSTGTNPAVQFRFIPEQTVIPAGGSVPVTVELTTNNLFLSNNSDLAGGYTGTLLGVGDDDTLKIPYAFFKGTMITLQFNELPWQVLVHDQKNFSKVLVPKSNTVSLIVKDGTYDVVASFYGSRYVVREGIAVAGKSDVTVNSTDALHPYSFSAVDEDGSVLPFATMSGTFSYIEGLVHRPTGFAIVSLGGGKIHPHVNRGKYFSTLSAQYSYGYSLNIQPSNALSYTYDVSLEQGISAPVSINLTRDDIKRVEMKYSVPPGTDRVFPIVWSSYMSRSSNVSVTFYDGTAEPLRPPFLQQTFYSKRSATFPIFHRREAYRY